MKLKSENFEDGEMIPQDFTCDGDDVSPGLIIEDVPGNASSLVLVMTDPDAPGGIWTHWIIWNIDPQTVEISQGNVPEDAIEGLNSGGGQGYQGPCPPDGIHHYHFKLYALDTKLDLDSMAERADLEIDMEDHILDEAELIGLYGHKSTIDNGL